MSTSTENITEVPTLTIGHRTFRFPYHGLCRPLTRVELDRMEASIRKHGIQNTVITDENDNVIDGEHRLLVANKLGIDLADIPFDLKVGLSGAQKKALAISLNEDRRQLSEEEIAERKARVRAMREEGKSLRQIAASEGISKTQIGRDLATSAVETVPGRDKKDDSGREFSTPEDSDTYDEDKERAGKNSCAKTLDNLPRAVKTPRAAFELASEIPGVAEACKEATGLINKAFAILFKASAGKASGHLALAIDDIGTHLDAAKKSVWGAVPYGVCPRCNGAGCEQKEVDRRNGPCLTTGVITEDVYDRLGGESRAKVDRIRDDAGAGECQVDQLGSQIPKKLRDVFADLFLADAAKQLGNMVRQAKSAQRWACYLRLADTVSALESAKQCFENSVPYCVHNECQGKGCDQCRGSGYLCEWRFLELAEQL